MSSYRPASTVIKAFTLLEYIDAHRLVRPAQISRGLGLSRTNVHRLLATFLRIGYVERDSQGRFRLSFKVFVLGSRAAASRDLRELGKPILVELRNKVNENIYLNVMHENRVIAIDEVRSRNPLVPKHDMTYSYPVYACASGKVFLASMEPGQRRRMMGRLSMKKLSPHTLTDPELLERELEQVRTEGYAREIGEFSADMNSYAAPIYDYLDHAAATISISGPSIRATREFLDGQVPHLLEAARRLSTQLGNKAGPIRGGRD